MGNGVDKNSESRSIEQQSEAAEIYKPSSDDSKSNSSSKVEDTKSDTREQIAETLKK